MPDDTTPRMNDPATDAHIPLPGIKTAHDMGEAEEHFLSPEVDLESNELHASLDLSPVRRAGLNCSAGGDFGVRAVAGCPAVAPAGGVPRAPGIAPSVSQG